MVLRTNALSHISTIFFVITCLNACSHLSSSSKTNRSPNNPIVPVENRTVLIESTPSKQAEPTSNTSTKQSQTNSETIEQDSPRLNIPSSKRLKPADVLGSVIDSAKKALEAQQWLRAQHHLEHALRIAPKDAEAFYLYGLVYQGLGVNDQANNMLKRSMFLAIPKSEIYQLAERKLADMNQ